MSDIPAKDTRRLIPRLNEENFPNILKLGEQLKAIGNKYGATPGQVALAWLLAQGTNVIPIPGTKKIRVCFHASFCLHHPAEARCVVFR